MDIKNYFKMKGIEIEREQKYKEDSISAHAYHIGRNYLLLEGMIKKIKRAYQYENYYLNWIVTNPSHLKSIHKILKQLEANNLIYRYKFSSNLIELRVNPNSFCRAFFLGIWLEKYICQIFYTIITKELCNYFFNLDYEILSNVILRFPSKITKELDVLVRIYDSFYWVECKTGDFEYEINKYRSLKNYVGFEDDNSFLVVPYVCENYAQQLAELSGINIYNLYNNKLHVDLSKKLFSDLIHSNKKKVQLNIHDLSK